MLPTPLVFLDTETTGLSVRRDRIIEVGLLRVEDNKIVAKYQTLLNPHTYVSPFITQVTGIKNSQLDNAPEFADIATNLYSLLENAVLVAHNARFDYGFLKNEFFHVGKTYSSKQLCTAKLSRLLFPTYRHHNLDSIIQRFDLHIHNRHRALDDAKTLWDFYKKIQKQRSMKDIEKAVSYLLRHPSLPSHLDPYFAKQLPESAGVYIFYDKENTPLYVGKSIHVKERVLSHFANDHKENREMDMSRQVKRIETISTSGELGALLKESELIKSLQPIYNRKLRATRRLIVLKERKNTQGFTEVVLEELTEISPDETRSIITTCKSKKQAMEYLYALKSEYQLCEKLLGLEKTSDACFSYRLGNCKGACIGKENPLAYNTRCILAFSKNKIKPWPFKGPIVISEAHEQGKTVDEFWVDKWCLLGKRTRDEYGARDFIEVDYRFDMDTYKILLQFLSHNIKSTNSAIRIASSALG